MHPAFAIAHLARKASIFNESGLATTLRRILGGSMLAVGLSVFLVRLGHAGPYALPQGGNLMGGLLALALGGWLAFRTRLLAPTCSCGLANISRSAHIPPR